MLLAVVNPADDGHHRVHKRLVVHAVLPMEVQGLRINAMEQVVGVYRCVLVAKESVDTLALLIVDALEALFRLVLILLDQRLVDVELLHAVLSGVLELLRSRHAVCLHGLTHLQGSIHADAVVAIQLLGIHATHRRAENQVGLFLLTDVAQQSNSLSRVDGQVWCNDLGLWHHFAQSGHRTRLSAASKAMTVEHCLACHQFRKLLDIWIFCYHERKVTKKFVTLHTETLKNMKKILLTLSLVAVSLLATAQLRNPVIPGFHPDPSVCRVGDDYYLVNSSFQYFPGVPVFHSKDLVNWTQIGNVLDRDSQLPLKGASSWLGIYAPTIRYNNGTYYMITTNVGNGGNFMVTATNPAGPWSEPIWLEQQGIDPSLWFENGKCYMVSNPDNTIMLCEIDPTTGKQLTPSKALWRGTGGRYPEGPHLYKKDGYYYLLISEGGTELAHRLTIARSKKIDGPYKANPANPLLTNCSMLGQSMQIQGTGHGDFVQVTDGSWWVVFLAYRNYGGAYHHLGRETYLAPVEWKKGQWPVINGGQPIDTLMQVQTLAPQLPRHAVTRIADWLYIQNPIRSNYQRQGEAFRLQASEGTLTDNQQPTFLGRRQESGVFTMETEIDTDSLGFGCKAGLTVYQINDGHMDVSLVKYMTGSVAVVMNYTVKSLQGEVMGDESGEISGRVRLRISSDGNNYRFEYACQGQPWKLLSEHACSLLSTEIVGGFTGAVVGMFAEGEGTADFSYFRYTE